MTLYSEDAIDIYPCMIEEQLTKICSHCNFEKSLNCFRKENYKNCISCVSEIARASRYKNLTPRQKKNTPDLEFKVCRKCKETKSTKGNFNQNGCGGYRGTCKYCEGYKDPVAVPEEIKKEKRRKYANEWKKAKRRELNPEKFNSPIPEYTKCKEFFRFKNNFITWVLSTIKNSDLSRQEILKFLPFSLDELKINLEYKFDSWMKWGNYGAFFKKEWVEADIATWRWKIYFKQNKEDLRFKSVNDENFKKYWSLDNLMPVKANFTFRDLDFVTCIDCKTILPINEFDLSDGSCKRCRKCSTIFSRKYLKPKIKVILSEEEIQKKKETKRRKIAEYHKIYRQNNKDKRKIWNQNREKRLANNPQHKLRKIISNAIYVALVRNNSSKNNVSVLKFLPFSIQNLKQHGN
jgi:hypothetical protein